MLPPPGALGLIHPLLASASCAVNMILATTTVTKPNAATSAEKYFEKYHTLPLLISEFVTPLFFTSLLSINIILYTTW
jgi:hypothetical protein